MSLFSFNWRQWLRGQRGRTATRKRKSRRKLDKRPRVEALEARYAPATFTWDGGGGGNNNWTLAANWQNDTAPTGVVSDELLFPTGPTSLVTNNDFNGATFGKITIDGGNYQLSGNPLTLGSPSSANSGEILVTSQGAGARIEAGMNITMTGSLTSTRQFITVQFGADLTISSQIASASSSVELTKGGQGTLVLSANNSGFTGLFTIDNNSGIVAITNAGALGDQFQGTRVGQNSQLQARSVSGVILEPLTLLGRGVANDGALLNFAGSNVWAGDIALDGDPAFSKALGATSGSLTITGQISDLGPGHNLIKEGPGEIIFTRDNTYRGTTTINNGILTIQTGSGLGTQDGTFATSTIVNSSVTGSGTLQLNYLGGGSPNAGFTVRDELITLNGPGFGGIGALNNLSGNNIWGERVVLGSNFPNGSNISIGSAVTGLFNGTALGLNIQGLVVDQQDLVPHPDNRIFNFTKVGAGRIILSNNNLYRGATTVSAGSLNIRDSGGLGSVAASTVQVNNNAALELEVDTGFDVHGRNLSADSVTGVANKLIVNRPLNITGRGAANDGALRNVSGINIYSGTIALANSTLSGAGSVAAVGVEPDPNPKPDNTYYTNDYSLTLSNVISPNPPPISGALTTFIKRGSGHLILTAANTYTGATQIEQGWITITNNLALGGRLGRTDAHSNATFQRGDTQVPTTTVSDGAALHLRSTAGDITLAENLVLNGTGIVHPFTLISQKGALMSLAGNNNVGGPGLDAANNFVSSDIELNGQVPIGVENPFGGASELTVTARIYDGASAGALTKLGSRRINIQGANTFSGNVNIAEGILRLQNDTGLGLVSSGTATSQETFTTSNTIIQAGTALELSPSVAQFAGGVSSGIQVWSEALFINGNGNSTFNLSPVTNLANDNMWRGTTTMGSASISIDFQNALGLADLPNMTADATQLTGTNPTVKIGTSNFGVVGTTNAQQSITFGGVVTGGTFTLTFRNATTAAIPYSQNPQTLATNIQNALNALPSVGANNTFVTWGGINSVLDIKNDSRLTLFGSVDDTPNLLPTGSNIIKVGFGELLLGGINGFKGNMDIRTGVVTAMNSQAFGSTGTAEIQTVTVSSPSGTFNITFDGQTTTNLAFDATALDVQNALNALASIGGVGGSVSVTKLGNIYEITFGGTLAGFNLPIMTATSSVGPQPSIGLNRDGGGGTIVEFQARLQLQGSITVAGEPLLIRGTGTGGTIQTNYTPRWFGAGPTPINQAQTPGGTPAAGRVTGVAIDQSDPNVIYVSTAGPVSRSGR